MEITLIKPILFTILMSGSALADPIMHCQYGGTMVLSVARAEYEEEPNSLFKVVVWNGETSGKNPNFVICEVNEFITVEYQHP